MSGFLPRCTAGAIACAAIVLALSGHTRATPAAVPSDDAAIIHAVDRLTFGATPDDLARARRMGLSAWIDEQLKPSSLDTRGLNARLATFETLGLSSGALTRDYLMPARRERRARQRANASRETMADQRDETRAPSVTQRKAQQVVLELSQAKVLRAVYSDRQLEEVLVDFWFNHFNVFAGKGQTRGFVTEYEREAIRPHVVGRFRDLLEATAKSPAMLFYLDNWISRTPDPAPQTRSSQRSRGLNENYARELLELHTLGVDGGYTQNDIVEVARAFTGWTLTRPDAGEFRFAPGMHDRGVKTVLGHTLSAGRGIEDGERVLDILAAHPSTARFVAMKLARRFVSDEPPPALVDRAAARFRDTQGDLREVVRTIVTSPEFFAADTRRTKVKTPFEFVVSALRVSRAAVDNALPVVRSLRDLGMPVYFCQPPTGYDDTAATWVSSGALVSRMNFALELASNRLRGISVPNAGTDLEQLRAELAQSVLHGRASASTLATIAQATTREQALALAIGSPEFQRR